MRFSDIKQFYFPPVGYSFDLPVIPPHFQKIFASHSSASSSFSAKATLQPTEEKSSYSICGELCYHLLAILLNLLKNPQTLDELVSNNKLHLLFEILSITTHVHDLGMLIIHKQLVRTLCQLASLACSTRSRVETLKKQVCGKKNKPELCWKTNFWFQNFFGYLLTMLGQKHSLSNIITLELCQVLVYTLKVKFFQLNEKINCMDYSLYLESKHVVVSFI